MKRITLLLVFALTITYLTAASVSAGTGDKVCDSYKPLVVQITARFPDGGEDYGFGFIVGEDTNRFYIVTANHVVRSKDPDRLNAEVQLRFSWNPLGKPIKATLMPGKPEGMDLALLHIDKGVVPQSHKVTWIGQAWCSQWKKDETAWFIGRDMKWYVPRDRRAGVLLNTRADHKGIVHVDIANIKPGTSGAPLIIENGIAGMILRDTGDEAQALDIGDIQYFVSMENPYPWNLLPCGATSTYYPPAKPVPVGKTQTVVITPTADKPPRQGDTMTDKTTGMELVYVPKGCFQMGSPADEKDRDEDEGPVHEVCVDGFWMGKHEVTKSQWQRFVKDAGYRSDAETNADGNEGCRFYKDGSWGWQVGYNWKKPGFSQEKTHPVVCISHNDTKKFLAWLNKESGNQYRLPTEAEWEYGCRAGGSDLYCGGNDIDALAWYSSNSGGATHPGGEKQANDFTLYDMSGNVWEWCADWYKDDYYSSSSKKNPQGASLGSNRVIRGGSWGFSSRLARAALRYWFSPSERYSYLGFRLVLPGQ